MFSLEIFESNYVLLIKQKIFYISIGFSSLNIFSYSVSESLQIIERANVFLKIYDISEFLNFIYLSQITQ